MVRRRISSGILAFLVMMAASMVAINYPASAAPSAMAVHAPIGKNSYVEGWGNVMSDCTSNNGCYAFVKLQHLPDDPRHASVANPDKWPNAASYWAVTGWNKITAPYRGCGTYRMTISIYNTVTSDSGADVVYANLGSGAKQYHLTSSFNDAHICRLTR